ncbi:MAG: hypothetical protein AB7V04_11935 [Desulfomonilaceae bacterium]
MKIRSTVTVILILCLTVFSVQAPASTCGPNDPSAEWSARVHEDNSIVSSLLYIPYMVVSIPWRLIDGIINPKPTSKATMPPAAHKAAPVQP